MTRRELFTLGLGAAVAVPFTPVPWKLLDDTAKWTQNWSWIPRPPEGERSVRYTSCTLCHAGCGMAARCVGPNVIGIAPVAGHPVSQGVLCPVAFDAHQLPFHPARITCTLRDGKPIETEKAIAEIASRVKKGNFAILDERPGRAVSDAYQRIAAANGGTYIACGPNAAGHSMALEEVRTLVSFGAPVLEVWATPGRVLNLWTGGKLAVVQIDTSLTKTAALASHALIVRPGTESLIADLFAGKIGSTYAAANTGVPQAKLEAAVRFVRERGPMLTITESSEPAIPRGSFDTVLIDHGLLGGSLDIHSLRAKTIVSLTPYHAGVAAEADFVLPTPAFDESLEEAPTPWDAVVPSYALAPALRNSPPNVTPALDFLSRAIGDPVTQESAIQDRLAKLHATRRGTVYAFAGRTMKSMAEFKTPADLRKAFDAGACWIDPTAKRSPDRTSAKSRESAVSPPLLSLLRSFQNA